MKPQKNTNPRNPRLISSLVRRPSLPGRSRFRLLYLLSLCLCAFVALCLTPGCERINSVDPQQIQAVAEEVNDLVVKVDIYQQTATTAIEQLIAAGAIDPNKAAKLLAANADVDRLQAAVQAISAALQSADYADNTTGLLTLIEAAQAANAATAVWNPYSAVIAAALTILSMVLSLALKKKTAALTAVAMKYQAHKQGVEKSVKDFALSSTVSSALVDATLYSNIGHARFDLGVT